MNNNELANMAPQIIVVTFTPWKDYHFHVFTTSLRSASLEASGSVYSWPMALQALPTKTSGGLVVERVSRA